MARSHEQAVAVGVVLAIAGGMLGGCMWPLSMVGPTMQAVGHLMPQAWAMDGFVKLVYGHQGVGAILPEALVLAGFAVVLSTLAALKLRSTLVRLA
jgi:ABC-2 type transport system permease protein